MTPHTPGPWTAGGVFIMAGSQYVGVVDSNETAHRARRKNSPPLATAYANASLFAAAPEMLEALKEAEMYFENWCEAEPTAQKAMALIRKAIAKAEGRAS